MTLALICVAAGNLDVAEDNIERSMRLDPLSPNRNIQLNIMAALRLAQRRFAEAVDASRDAVQIDGSPLGLGLLASAKAKLDDEEGTRQVLGKFRALSRMTLEQVAARFYARPEHCAIFMEGLERFDADPVPAQSKAVMATSKNSPFPGGANLTQSG